MEAGLKAALEILERQPKEIDALMSAAAYCLQLGVPRAAEGFCRRAIKAQPNLGIAHFTLGRALGDLGDWEGGLAAWRRAQVLDPEAPAVPARIAQALLMLGRTKEASLRAREVMNHPGTTQATLILLGHVFHRLRDEPSGREVLERALAYGEDGEAHTCLGLLCMLAHQATQALFHFKRAVELAPGDASARSNLGNAFLAMGDAERGLPLLEEAISLDPENREWVTGGIFSLSTDPGMTIERVYEKTVAWVNAAYPLRPPMVHKDHDRSPERRLRVGYVSPDFRHHAMAHWIAPLLQNRDRESFEVFCFSENSRKDAVTQKFKEQCDRWIATSGLTDEILAERIVSLKIDVLVDLAGHTAGNRLGVFNMKPAPVQVMMLGFDRTSGLQAMDWRITTDNSEGGDADLWSTERIWRLNGRFCYKPLEDAPEVSPSPVTRNGFLTFGFLGNHARVGPAYLKAAARLLLEIPDARLLLLSREGEDEAHMAFKRGFFLAAGVEPERILFCSRTCPESRFLAYYQDVDITLNSFPAEGGTTICESLWMGVPVLVLDRPEALRHAGKGLLEHMGMPDWVASDLDAWIHIAKTWNLNRDALNALRQVLRARMAQSSLCDGPSALRAIEAAYRGMWRTWCAQGS